MADADANADEVPFPELPAGRIRAQHVAVAPDGTAHVVPSGMHERLRQAVLGAGDGDPKVALARAGWASLQTDGLVDRVNVDAPDGFDHPAVVRRFARAHEAGRVVVAFHPSGETRRFDGPDAVGLGHR